MHLCLADMQKPAATAQSISNLNICALQLSGLSVQDTSDGPAHIMVQCPRTDQPWDGDLCDMPKPRGKSKKRIPVFDYRAGFKGAPVSHTSYNFDDISKTAFDMFGKLVELFEVPRMHDYGLHGASLYHGHTGMLHLHYH